LWPLGSERVVDIFKVAKGTKDTYLHSHIADININVLALVLVRRYMLPSLPSQGVHKDLIASNEHRKTEWSPTSRTPTETPPATSSCARACADTGAVTVRGSSLRGSRPTYVPTAMMSSTCELDCTIVCDASDWLVDPSQDREKLRMLSVYGADLNAANDAKGLVPRHVSLRDCRYRPNLLLGLAGTWCAGATLLHMAVNNNDVDTVALLLDCDVAPDPLGSTPCASIAECSLLPRH
jgi:hypothetical protein